MLLAKKTINDAGAVLNNVAGKTGVQQTDITTLVGQIVQGLLGVVALVFLILTIYGGFLWMTSRGNEEQVAKARDTLIRAIIGLIVIVSSYALTDFVIKALTS
jgi:hypothetical protein